MECDINVLRSYPSHLLPDQVHHPSALSMFDQITSSSKGKRIVVFLDYDGTLSPIVDDPDRAFMSNEVSISPCKGDLISSVLLCIVLCFYITDFFSNLCWLKWTKILSDESGSKTSGKVFPHCYCDWKVQGQGTLPPFCKFHVLYL